MSIRTLTTIFLTVTFAIPAIAQDAATATALPKAAEIVAKHVEAVGGREKLEAMKSSVSEGSFEMPAMGLKGDFTIKLMSGKFAFEMDLPGIGPIARGTDGENAWEVSAAGGGARLLKGIEKKQLIQQAELAAELKMEEKFDIEVVGIEKSKRPRLLQTQVRSQEGVGRRKRTIDRTQVHRYERTPTAQTNAKSNDAAGRNLDRFFYGRLSRSRWNQGPA